MYIVYLEEVGFDFHRKQIIGTVVDLEQLDIFKREFADFSRKFKEFNTAFSEKSSEMRESSDKLKEPTYKEKTPVVFGQDLTKEEQNERRDIIAHNQKLYDEYYSKLRKQDAAINEICFENVSLELGYDKESYIYRILKDNIHGWNSDFDNKDLTIEYKKVSSLPTFHTFLLENYLKD